MAVGVVVATVAVVVVAVKVIGDVWVAVEVMVVVTAVVVVAAVVSTLINYKHMEDHHFRSHLNKEKESICEFTPTPHLRPHSMRMRD